MRLPIAVVAFCTPAFKAHQTTHHTTAHQAISHILASDPSFNIGFTPPYIAPSLAHCLKAHIVVLAQALATHHIGATAIATSGRYVPALKAVESNSGELFTTSSIFFTSSQNPACQNVTASRALPPYFNTVSRFPAPNIRVLYNAFCARFHSLYFFSKSAFSFSVISFCLLTS